MAYGLALITANEGWGLGLGAANGRIELLRLVAVWVVQGGALFAVGTLASLLSLELQRTGAALDRSASDLRILRDIHRSTVESIVSGLLTTDSAGCISSFNPEAERITGLQADVVMGLDLESVIPGAIAVLPGFGGRPLEASARTRLSYQNDKGERLYLGLGDSILRAEDGEAQGHVVIFQDVTDVVAMESDLTRSERLAAVGELSAKIAHEIRNPLASISGSIQILASESDVTGESARLMGIVVRETDRLNHLITDFLRYARPAPTVTRPVEVDRLFADLIEMIEPTGSSPMPTSSPRCSGTCVSTPFRRCPMVGDWEYRWRRGRSPRLKRHRLPSERIPCRSLPTIRRRRCRRRYQLKNWLQRKRVGSRSKSPTRDVASLMTFWPTSSSPSSRQNEGEPAWGFPPYIES
jgi:PAS domain S-box-containing protein